MNTLTQTKSKHNVQPEDNWQGAGNPDVYLDKLPQPYRFINKCLDQLILKPVFNQITIIEQRKKTPEYEGNLKEVSATGFHDLDAITCMTKMNQVILAGGVSEKADAPTLNLDSHLSKLLLGDNFGNVHLMDVSRKQVLDRISIPLFKSRRIIDISTASLEWINTRLTYAAIVARGSPIVALVVFRHNENKLYHIFSINTCPELENPDCLEKNPKQTYLPLPCCSKFSLDAEFMSITKFDGRVIVVKMPPVIDPI